MNCHNEGEFNLGAVDPLAKSLTFCWLKGNVKGIQKVKV